MRHYCQLAADPSATLRPWGQVSASTRSCKKVDRGSKLCKCVNDGMMAWGDRMLKYTGKPRADMYNRIRAIAGFGGSCGLGELALLAVPRTQCSLAQGSSPCAPDPHLCPGPVQLPTKPRRRALQTQPPPRAFARVYPPLAAGWSSVAGAD